MAKQNKQKKKTKAKEFAYKAVSKVGHGLRKAGPFLLTIAVVIVGKASHKDSNDNDSTSV